MSTDKTPESEAAQPVLAVPARVEPQRADMIAALRFYASGQHFCRSDDTAWDTTSGEPQNWWCDEAGTATIEDGAIAAMVLDGRLNAAQIEFLGDGEVVPEPVEAAQPAPTAAEALCMCGDRASTACPGEWEPGCDLGNNPAYVRVAQPAPTAAPAEPHTAVVYPPDGTVSPFTVINLGSGKVQMGDSVHDGRLPALWFGKNGRGMGHEEDMNREAHEGETLAVVTFANVEGLDVLASVIQRVRRDNFPAATPPARLHAPLSDEQIAALVRDFYAGRAARDNTPEAIVRAVERAHGIGITAIGASNKGA